MKRMFCNLFALHPHELKKVFYFVTLAFFWSLAASLGQRSSDIIFLIKIGSKSLPSIYAQTAVAFFATSGALLYAYNRLSGNRVFFMITISGTLFYAIIAALLSLSDQPPKIIWFPLRIFSSLFLYTMISTFWSFINLHFEAAEAKRLFGLFTSFVFLGAGASGLILEDGRLNMAEILMIVILLLLLVSFMIRFLSTGNSPQQCLSASSKSAEPQLTIKKILKYIFSSHYVTLIITANFLAFFLWVVTEYNYMSAFEERFIAKNSSSAGSIADSALSVFMGKCITATSVINLIFGIFLYSRVIKYFGVSTAIFFTPLLYLITFAGWLFNNSLLFPTMGFFIVEGTCEITDDSNFNLLIKRLHPKINSFLRVIVDMIFEPLGMLLSACTLSIPNINSKILGIVLATSALTVAFFIRRLLLTSEGDESGASAQKEFV